MGNTWRKSDTFRDEKHKRELRKNLKRMHKLAKKHGVAQVDEEYQDDYESHYGEED